MLQITILVHSGYLGQNYIDNRNLYSANGYNIPLTTNGPLMNLQFGELNVYSNESTYYFKHQQYVGESTYRDAEWIKINLDNPSKFQMMRVEPNSNLNSTTVGNLNDNQ